MNTAARNSAAPPARNSARTPPTLPPFPPRRYRTYFATFAETYPEFMTTLIVINAPAIFTGLWNVMKNLLDAEVVAKVSIFGSDKQKQRDELERHGITLDGPLATTPLHVACDSPLALPLVHEMVSNAKRRAVSQLGEAVEALNLQGEGVLHRACSRRQADVAKILLEAGARCDARSSAGDTALHCAAREGLYEIAEHLLEKPDVALNASLMSMVKTPIPTPNTHEQLKANTARLLNTNASPCTSSNFPTCDNSPVNNANPVAMGILIKFIKNVLDQLFILYRFIVSFAMVPSKHAKMIKTTHNA